MNRLAAILPTSGVLVGVDATSKKRVFEHAGLLFENQHAIARAMVTDNLFARERLGSTGLGHGVAIPHGRIKGLKNPLAAVLRVQQPIGFDAPDDEPVALLIFLLVPEAATQRLEVSYITLGQLRLVNGFASLLLCLFRTPHRHRLRIGYGSTLRRKHSQTTFSLLDRRCVITSEGQGLRIEPAPDLIYGALLILRKCPLLGDGGVGTQATRVFFIRIELLIADVAPRE